MQADALEGKSPVERLSAGTHALRQVLPPCKETIHDLVYKVRRLQWWAGRGRVGSDRCCAGVTAG